jgi:hypothetical protein
MSEVTVVYSPQCPSNVHFINQMREWSRPYGVEFQAIDAFEEHERAAEYLKETPVGYTRHLFITVFVDGRWVPGHPGNPRFREEFIDALEGGGG